MNESIRRAVAPLALTPTLVDKLMLFKTSVSQVARFYLPL